MMDRHRISKRLKVLGAGAIAAALMAASAQAATVFDLTSGLGSPAGGPLLDLFTGSGLPEPATMMIIGTALLTAFRARPHA